MKNKGITLVALVVTIVIMLILAGVTLNLALGDNGLFKMAEKTVGAYQLESEREALEMSVATYQLGKSTGSEEGKLGKGLVDRNVENGQKWDEVFVTGESGEKTAYGNGWNYVEEKKDDIEGFGIAKHNWLVNYETGEIIMLGEQDGEEVGDYKNLDWKSSVAVHEGLLSNLDATNASLDPSSWGDNTTLYYYDNSLYGTYEQRQKGYKEECAYDSVEDYPNGYDRQIATNINDYLDEEAGAFNFNGTNYIEIHDNNGFDFSQGFTFEFYGKLTGGVAALYNNWYVLPMFCLSKGKFKDFAGTPCSFQPDTNEFAYALKTKEEEKNQLGEFSEPYGESTRPHTQRIKWEDFALGQDVYFTLSIGPDNANAHRSISILIH